MSDRAGTVGDAVVLDPKRTTSVNAGALGYSAGKCHCEHCRAAYAIYRAQRRSSGVDSRSR
jgi:hypothetical protein